MESIQKAVSNVMNAQKDHEKNADSSSPSIADSVSATAKKCSTTLSDKKDSAKDAVASEADKASEGASCAKGKCESKAAEVSDCASKKYSGEGSCGGSPCA